jgi:hypothetical protein
MSILVICKNLSIFPSGVVSAPRSRRRDAGNAAGSVRGRHAVPGEWAVVRAQDTAGRSIKSGLFV